MSLVAAARFANSFEAGLAQARLEAEGIASFLFDAEMGLLGVGGFQSIRLMVEEQDLDAALRTLAD